MLYPCAPLPLGTPDQTCQGSKEKLSETPRDPRPQPLSVCLPCLAPRRIEPQKTTILRHTRLFSFIDVNTLFPSCHPIRPCFRRSSALFVTTLQSSSNSEASPPSPALRSKTYSPSTAPPLDGALFPLKDLLSSSPCSSPEPPLLTQNPRVIAVMRLFPFPFQPYAPWTSCFARPNPSTDRPCSSLQPLGTAPAISRGRRTRQAGASGAALCPFLPPSSSPDLATVASLGSRARRSNSDQRDLPEPQTAPGLRNATVTTPPRGMPADSRYSKTPATRISSLSRVPYARPIFTSSLLPKSQTHRTSSSISICCFVFWPLTALKILPCLCEGVSNQGKTRKGKKS
ncbi:hypothetical protein B0T11DRAFT_50593 [Plectosphaerella cucumerina]|uniref:Uncharacterized protein n=1 Tax=Plectosphaerella cucumerina TaxID=40658 RepID=A0A8K0TL31_9PEZI|nr:hypothetical protein B0T11DRAFT_50593 [Plectosphaerella cucumerina]